MGESIFDFWFIWLVIIILAVYPFIRSRLLQRTSLPVAWDQVAALERENFKVIHNFRVELHGLPARIDYLIITEAGIFVIKALNVKGKVSGYETDQEWINALGPLKTRFPNPIRVSGLLIDALKEKLKDYPAAPLIPVTVLPDQAKMEIGSSSGKVIKAGELEKMIRNRPGKKLTSEEMEMIYNSLVLKHE